MNASHLILVSLFSASAAFAQSQTPTEQPSASLSLQQPQKKETHLSGSITTTVNAASTPLGEYRKMLNDMVGEHWYRHMAEHPSMALGTVEVSFWVDPSGRIKDAKVTINTSSEASADVCLQSILETTLPPIPEKVASVLPPKGLESGIRFTFPPNGQANQLLSDATLAYSAGDYDRAIDLVDSALAVIKPDEAAPALLFRGRAYLKKGELDKAESDFNEVTDLDSKQYLAYIGRAIIYNRKKDHTKALRQLDSISSLKLDKAGRALNGVAWLRATFPEPELRDGNKATQEALQACEASHWEDFGYVDTLAAAYAETGNFEQAVKFEEQAVGMLSPENSLRDKMERRLALYQDHKPYREDPLDR
jgi:hypothetical protein